jgi:hypothetical protein
MPPVLHIGSPKTGTTTLQEDVIPRLGRPYQIKPAWSRSVSRLLEFERPPSLPDDVIVSDEILGEFATFPPKVIAARLATVFHGATVIFTVRDPVSLFLSLYRQQVINIMSNQHRIFKTVGRYGVYLAPDHVFDVALEDYRVHGRGLFAITNLAGLRATFGASFNFVTLDFDLLTRDPAAYVAQFCALCGVPPVASVGRSNATSRVTFEKALADLPSGFPGELTDAFRSQYETPLLSADRIAFLRKWVEPPPPLPT